MNTKLNLEATISNIIFYNNGCHTNFEYKTTEFSQRELKITTYNPKKDETFLLFSILDTSDESALLKVLDWIKGHTQQEYSHTVVWTKIGSGSKTYVSYFYTKNALEALLKFYDNKDRSEYIVYEVKLNPIA